jgi:hypothetical protein
LTATVRLNARGTRSSTVTENTGSLDGASAMVIIEASTLTRSRATHATTATK